jgi:hypothetical protein
MPIANRSTSVRAKPTGLGQRSGDGVYDRGSNVARPRADGGEQESLLAEQRELGNNLGERKVESAWPGKVTGRDTVNATISMRTDFLVGTAKPKAQSLSAPEQRSMTIPSHTFHSRIHSLHASEDRIPGPVRANWQAGG